MKTPDAPYRASSHTVLRGEAHTAAETLIMPCVVEKETCGLGEESKKKLKQFSYLMILLNITFKIRQQI